MTFEQSLPERLRNKGIQPSPTEKVTIILSEHQINALSEILPNKTKRAKGA